MSGGDDLAHLRAAFDSLLTIAPPERADLALKLAIKTLVDAPRVRIANRSPNISGADQARWSELKPKLRRHLADAKLGMAALAAATELPLSTVQRALSPAGPAPGRAIVELLAQWLAAAENPPSENLRAENARPPRNGVETTAGEGQLRPSAAPTAGFAGRENHSPAQTSANRAEPPPARVETAPARPGNGHDPAAGPPRRLSDSERQALAFVVEHDPAAVRAISSLDLAERAVAGALLPGAAVQRLLAALGGPAG